MTYGHLRVNCLYTGISSRPNALCRVWEAFTFLCVFQCFLETKSAGIRTEAVCLNFHKIYCSVEKIPLRLTGAYRQKALFSWKRLYRQDPCTDFHVGLLLLRRRGIIQGVSVTN